MADPVPRAAGADHPVDQFAVRRATRADVSGLAALVDAAVGELQRGFLGDAQIAASPRARRRRGRPGSAGRS